MFGSAEKATPKKGPDASNDGDDVLPVEKRIKGKEPTCDGLYPHEVLVLSYAHKFCDKGNEFQGFWWYKYGIRNVQAVLNSLSSRALIQQGSIGDAVNMKKLPEIKEELQKHGLKVSGKKADLVKRLTDSVDDNELSAVFTKRPYSLTEQGTQILKKYEWIPYIHSHMIEDLDIWNLTELVQTPPYMKYRDKIWGYMNKRGMEHFSNRNYGLYRSNRFAMSEFVAEEGKTTEAFSLLSEVVAYDLSGLSNGFRMELIDIYADSFFPYESSIVTMAPGITVRIQKYGDELGWSETELKTHLISEFNKFKLPFQLFSVEECAEIVLAEIHEDKDTLSRLYAGAEKRFKKTNKK